MDGDGQPFVGLDLGGGSSDKYGEGSREVDVGREGGTYALDYADLLV